MLRSVPGFHFLHPSHVPVPRRHRLRLTQRIAFRPERRVQGAERRGWRREVCTEEREEREEGTLTCILRGGAGGALWRKLPFFSPQRRRKNKINISRLLKSSFHSRPLGEKAHWEASLKRLPVTESETNIASSHQHHSGFLKVPLHFKELQSVARQEQDFFSHPYLPFFLSPKASFKQYSLCQLKWARGK